MSSPVRSIQRTVRWVVEDDGERVLKTRRAHYLGRGVTLGIHRPAAAKPSKNRGSRRGVQKHLKDIRIRIVVGPTARRNRPDVEAHRAKMALRRRRIRQSN